MQKFEITQEQLQQIVNYLTTKPFGEVFQLINEIQKLPKIEEEPEQLKKQ